MNDDELIALSKVISERMAKGMQFKDLSDEHRNVLSVIRSKTPTREELEDEKREKLTPLTIDTSSNVLEMRYKNPPK